MRNPFWLLVFVVLGCAHSSPIDDEMMGEIGVGPVTGSGGSVSGNAEGGAGESTSNGGAGGAGGTAPAPGGATGIAGATGSGGVMNVSGAPGYGGTQGAGGFVDPATTGGFPGVGGTISASGGVPVLGTGGAINPPGVGGTSGSGGTVGTGGIPVNPGTGGAVQSGCPATTPVPGSVRSATRKIKDLTGTSTSSGQFGVGGTDLGIAVRQPNGKIAYIFGDTFEQDGVGGPGWRSPVLLRSEPGFDANGIDFNGAAGGQYAKQILPYAHDNGTTWLPSDAITIGNRMYLHFIVNQGLGNVQRTGIAYSDDNGENWTVSSAQWGAAENDGLRQLWTWERGCDGYVYTLSTKFISRDRAIILHRVPEAQILDHNAYEPWGWNGSQWGWGNPATIVLDGAFGEMSLRRVEHKWVLAWFNAGNYEITIKVFASPTSNLYDATTYHPIRGGDWCTQNDTTVAQLYGGYIHPDSTLHDMHLVVSQWNTGVGPCHTVQDSPYHAMEFVTGVD